MSKESQAWREIIQLVLGCALWFREIDARGLERVVLVDRDEKLKSISRGEMENKQPIDQNFFTIPISTKHPHTERKVFHSLSVNKMK